jgi:hypothetical protein
MFMTLHSAEKECKSLVREVDFILWQCVFPNKSFVQTTNTSLTVTTCVWYKSQTFRAIGW